VTGDALATLEVAELLLDARRLVDAEHEANDAVSLARRNNMPNESIEATVAWGRALRGQDKRAEGLEKLREAAALARAAGNPPRSVADVQLALGDALAEDGRSAEALVAYDRAASAVELLSGRFEEETDRARVRDRRAAVFDAAVRTILTSEPADIQALLRWEQRRKSAALGAGRVIPGAAVILSAAKDLQFIQRHLARDEALIDYAVLDSMVTAMVVTRTRALVVPLDVTPAELAESVARLRRPLASAYMGHVDVARAYFDTALAARLYDALVRPAVGDLPRVTRLAIVPDGVLRLLPFDALVVSIAPTEYLLDRYVMTLLPVPDAPGDVSLTLSDRLLLVHTDVPGGADELRGTRSAWGGADVKVIEGEAATPESVSSALPKYEVIHLATHAVASREHAASSYVALAGGNLNAGEVTELRLSAKLVVLSACETESGPILLGAGPMSIARAFLVAGADAVVATDWPVSDVAAEVVSRFYADARRGARLVKALRAAKLALRNRVETSHPFYWAPFVFVGRGVRYTSAR
jgi:CHAT domain-containing protein